MYIFSIKNVKIYYSMLIFILLFSRSELIAETQVSGAISTDTEWTTAGNPYIVIDDLAVNFNATLTISAGVIVEFNPQKILQVNGTLIARGTENNPILFTSRTTSWGHIFFANSSTDASFDISENYIDGSILEYCIVENAGDKNIDNNGALRITNAHPFINYCTIKNNMATAIYAWDLEANLRIANSIIKNNSGLYGGGVYAYAKSNLRAQNLQSLVN